MGLILHYTKDEIEDNNNIISIGSPCRLGISFDRQPNSQTGLDTYFNDSRKDFTFKMYTNTSTATITVGKTHIYELTQPILINSLVFENGVPETIGIDIIYESEEEA